MEAYHLLGSVEHGVFDEIVTKINNQVVDVVRTGERPDGKEPMAVLPRILPKLLRGPAVVSMPTSDHVRGNFSMVAISHINNWKYASFTGV